MAGHALATECAASCHRCSSRHGWILLVVRLEIVTMCVSFLLICRCSEDGSRRGAKAQRFFIVCGAEGMAPDTKKGSLTARRRWTSDVRSKNELRQEVADGAQADRAASQQPTGIVASGRPRKLCIGW